MYEYMKSKKILQLNPNHNLIISMYEKYTQDKKKDVVQMLDMIYDTALLLSGYQLDNTIEYAKKMFDYVSTFDTNNMISELSKNIDIKPDLPENSSTDSPSTELPSTELPSTELPSTELPSTELPSTELPSTELPSTAST